MMTDDTGAAIRDIVRRLQPGTVVRYGDISQIVYDHRQGGPSVGQAIKAEAAKTGTSGESDSFPWWRVTHDDLRPVDGAGARLDDENVTFCSDGTVHPKHHDPGQIEGHPMPARDLTTHDTSAHGIRTARLVYILYLSSLLFGPLAAIGIVFAFVNRGSGGVADAHFRFQIRTFWIGLLYLVISIAAMFILIGFLMILVWALWWIVRAVKGLKFLSQGDSYPNTETWLW